MINMKNTFYLKSAVSMLKESVCGNRFPYINTVKHKENISLGFYSLMFPRLFLSVFLHSVLTQSSVNSSLESLQRSFFLSFHHLFLASAFTRFHFLMTKVILQTNI